MPTLLNRQKALLGYIYIAGRIKSRTTLLKSFFLLCKEELPRYNRTLYDFFPYKFGPFSITLLKFDLKRLVKIGLVSENSYRVVNKKHTKEILAQLDSTTLEALRRTYKKYGAMSTQEIKSYVYQNYPYFAIRNIKNPEEYSKYDPANDPVLDEPKIFTIGYEGRSLENFLNELIVNNIKVLVDIRSNPRSMKYGFSGSVLKHYVEGVGVKYLSAPELGIEGKYRKHLLTENDYIRLFEFYEREILPRQTEKIKMLKNLIVHQNRIALMCFEREQERCHRGIASKYLSSNCNNFYGVLHI